MTRTNPPRMWMLDVSKMCRQHLIAEHLDCHGIIKTLAKSKGFAELAPLARKGHLELYALKDRHKELADEMKRRGIPHRSPLPAFDSIDIGEIDLIESLASLCTICPECAKGFAVNPDEADPIIDTTPEPIPQNGTSKKGWYALKVRPGREIPIRSRIYREAFIDDLEGLLGRILIPAEKITEIKKGKPVTSRQKKFLGYLICEIVWDYDIQQLLRKVRGISHFVGSWQEKSRTTIPTPLRPEEVETLLLEEKAAGAKPGIEDENTRRKITIGYTIGDTVQVKYGDYKGVEGIVADIDDSMEDKDPTATITVMILGEPAPITLECWKAVKISQ
jgi:transcription termination/antitermination protein NusG